MLGCVHYWRQEPGDLSAPFVCQRCGSVQAFETNYFALIDKREAGSSFRTTKSPGSQSVPAAVAHEPITTGDTEPAAIPRILVVDDEAVTVWMIKRLLENQLGCDVETALNGNQALAKASEFRPDLALLDIRMPDMDGFEVCRRFKGNPFTATSAIVYVSAYPEPEGPLENAQAYLTKPLEPATLVRTVRSLVMSV